MLDDFQIKTAQTKAKLLNDLLLFTKAFFKIRHGKEFRISQPIGRRSHFLEIADALTDVFMGNTKKLIINIPPRYGKTELLINFIAWTLARYPDSNYLYISVSHDLASRATSQVKDIISTAHYKDIFNIELRDDTTAKDNFSTTDKGVIQAIGSGGTIVGKGAGLQGVNRFGGAIILDDVHKPDEVASDVMRNGVIEWFYNTLLSRRNDGEKTPIIGIGQSLHENDLFRHLANSNTGWKLLSLPALDEHENALYPEMHSSYELKKMREAQRYVFAAQMQQNPLPAGGGLFKINDFKILDTTPTIKMTFITADTAETDKTYNDATSFSLWGLYEVEQFGKKTGFHALHWINCVEIHVEPKDLQANFMDFYSSACSSGMIPALCAIEKKSTGVTLVSILKDIQGLNILPVDVTSKSGSKMDRFIGMQHSICQKLITLPYGAKHTKMCIDHMTKITANNTHTRDDIADTCQMAIKIALVDKTIGGFVVDKKEEIAFANKFMQTQLNLNKARINIWN